MTVNIRLHEDVAVSNRGIFNEAECKQRADYRRMEVMPACEDGMQPVLLSGHITRLKNGCLDWDHGIRRLVVAGSIYAT